MGFHPLFCKDFGGVERRKNVKNRGLEAGALSIVRGPEFCLTRASNALFPNAFSKTQLAELFAVVRLVGQGEAMTYLIIKAAVSGILVMIISEVARRSPGLGGLIASLPLVSLLGIIWLWRDTSDLERIASHAESTFWFVLPSLPMFLVFPAMLRHGIGFWLALALSCVLTMVLYLLTIWILPKIGIDI